MKAYNWFLAILVAAIITIVLFMWIRQTIAKDDPNLLIHSWCVPHTPQWKAGCARKVKCPAGWEKALAGMENCMKEKH